MSIIKSTFVALTLTVIAMPAYAEPPELGGEEGGPEYGRQMRRGERGNPGKHFAKIDTNGDGKLSEEELAAVGKGKWEEKFEERFNKRDLDGNGSISKEEAVQGHKNKMAEKFKKADSDGDGYLSKEEMKNLRKHRKGKRPMRGPRPNRGGGFEE